MKKPSVFPVAASFRPAWVFPLLGQPGESSFQMTTDSTVCTDYFSGSLQTQ